MFGARPWVATLPTTAAALLAAFVLLAVAPSNAAVAADDFITGSGEARGTVLAVGPVSGRLSLVVSFGQSLADYQGSVGRAQSRYVDLALLGVLITARQCQGRYNPILDPTLAPKAVRVDSTEPHSDTGRTGAAVAPAGSGPLGASVGRQQAWASSLPSSRAVSTLGSFVVPGLLEVGGGEARAEIRAPAKQRIREAKASSIVQNVSLLGGLVRLEGLRWDVLQTTGPEGKTMKKTGSFRIGSATVAGQSIATPDADATSTLKSVNEALAMTGITLDPPHVDVVNGVVTMTPMGIRMFDSPLAQQTVRPAVAAAYPVRHPVGDAIVAIDCRLAAALEVGDTTVNSLSGAGGILVNLGGASATTDGTRFTSPFTGIGLLGLPSTHPDFSGAGDGSVPAADAAALPSVAGGSLLPGTPLAGVAPSVGLSSATRVVPGGRGGAALAAGLIGLVVVAVLAMADYARMRQRAGEAGVGA